MLPCRMRPVTAYQVDTVYPGKSRGKRPNRDTRFDSGTGFFRGIRTLFCADGRFRQDHVRKRECTGIARKPFSGLPTSDVPFSRYRPGIFQGRPIRWIRPGSRLLRADGALKAEVHGLSG